MDVGIHVKTIFMYTMLGLRLGFWVSLLQLSNPNHDLSPKPIRDFFFPQPQVAMFCLCVSVFTLKNVSLPGLHLFFPPVFMFSHLCDFYLALLSGSCPCFVSAFSTCGFCSSCFVQSSWFVPVFATFPFILPCLLFYLFFLCGPALTI